jgi:hypothetical protein
MENSREVMADGRRESEVAGGSAVMTWPCRMGVNRVQSHLGQTESDAAAGVGSFHFPCSVLSL